MPLQASGKAPYAPADSVLTIIKKYRDHGLTAPFTGDVLLRAGVTESLVPRTLNSLRQLDLVDEEGKPLESLDELQRAPTAELQSKFREWVRTTYAPIFQFVDLSTATVEQVEDALRGYEPKGQRARMVSLFLGLCAEAGIVDKEAARARASSRRSSPAPVRKHTDRPATTKRAPSNDKSRDLPPAPSPPVSLEAAKAKYLDLLMSKLAAQDVPEPELLDRIERVLGIGGGEQP